MAIGLWLGRSIMSRMSRGLPRKFELSNRATGSMMGVLLGWYLFENLKTFPYYLTYFNQVAGGPKGGYLYVVDSNVDWGQDAKRLADYERFPSGQRIPVRAL